MNLYGKVCIRIGVIVIVIGIIATALGFCFGGNWNLGERKSDNMVDSNETYVGVKSIDLDISFGKVNIQTGDAFKIEAKNVNEKSFQSYIEEDGTWVIKDENKDHGFNLVNWDFSFPGWNRSNNYSPEIMIYLPKDFKADNLNITLGAGASNIEALKAEKASFDIGAGSLNIDTLTLNDKSSFQVGAGSIDINNINAKDIKIDSGAGKVELEGIVSGNGDINCGVGTIKMNLRGNEKDYNYSVDCGIGNVIINNNKYTFKNKTDTHNNYALYNFDLECGVGKIELYIN